MAEFKPRWIDIISYSGRDKAGDVEPKVLGRIVHESPDEGAYFVGFEDVPELLADLEAGYPARPGEGLHGRIRAKDFPEEFFDLTLLEWSGSVLRASAVQTGDEVPRWEKSSSGPGVVPEESGSSPA